MYLAAGLHAAASIAEHELTIQEQIVDVDHISPIRALLAMCTGGTMKRLRVLLFPLIILFAVSLTAATQPVAASDTTAYTTTAIQLRAEPSAAAHVLATLEAGTPVRLNGCADGWCKVTQGGRTGYLLEELLTSKPSKPPEARGRGYKNSRGVWVPSPQRTPDNQPPQGATALCRDGTYSFSQSRRGTCSHHGGVAQWL
jgi:uncharacterized protein YraI